MNKNINENAPENPFVNKQIVCDPNQLVGRGDLLKEIYGIIAAKGNLSLIGPSGIGKGSLLACLHFTQLHQRYGSNHLECSDSKYTCLYRCIFVFIDMRDLARRSWEEFFKRLNKKIKDQSQHVVDLTGLHPTGSEGFTALIDEIADQGYHLVLAFDSFEKLRENERLSDPLPTFLRGEVPRVSYIVASKISLDEIFLKEPSHSPFYNIFSSKEIGGLARIDEFCELIIALTTQAGLPFSEEEVRWIVAQAGTYPAILWRVCQVLFDLKLEAPRGLVDLERSKETVYKVLYPYFKSFWSSMNEQQREKLSRALYRQEEQAFYHSALLRRFVAAQGAEIIPIQIQEVEDALKHLSDNLWLGQNSLRHLKIVELHLNHDRTPTQVDFGFALRTVLTEALESLRGPGTRTDKGQDWIMYNILSYRYFKHFLSNRAVSTRLELSERSYYRYYQKALDQLSRALQEMEDNCHNR